MPIHAVCTTARNPPAGSGNGTANQPVSAADDPSTASESKSALDGEWSVVAIRGDKVDIKANETQGMRWSIRNGVTTRHDPDGPSRRMNILSRWMNFTLDQITPPRMDITLADGGRQGLTAHCIYRLEGSRLLICFPETGADWPAEFTVGADSWSIELERIPVVETTGTDAASTSGQKTLLEGDWAIVSMRGNGVAATAKELQSMRWSIRGDTITAFQDGLSGRETFTLDHNHAPRRIDITAADGNRKGETDHCIYRLEGSRLLIQMWGLCCWPSPPKAKTSFCRLRQQPLVKNLQPQSKNL